MGRIREYLDREPAAWQRALAPLLAPAIASVVGQRRGVALGLAALVVYGGLFLPFAVAPDAVKAWSARHPALDRLLCLPLLFFALLVVSPLSTPYCAGVALACGIPLLVVTAVARRGANV